MSSPVKNKKLLVVLLLCQYDVIFVPQTSHQIV